jgi:hypothetical protein
VLLRQAQSLWLKRGWLPVRNEAQGVSHIIRPAFVLLLCFAVQAKATELPKLENLHGYGCELKGSGDNWTLEVWATHGGERDWKFIASANSSLAKSLKRCNEFMRQVEKATKQKAKH